MLERIPTGSSVVNYSNNCWSENWGRMYCSTAGAAGPLEWVVSLARYFRGEVTRQRFDMRDKLRVHELMLRDAIANQPPQRAASRRPQNATLGRSG